VQTKTSVLNYDNHMHKLRKMTMKTVIIRHKKVVKTWHIENEDEQIFMFMITMKMSTGLRVSSQNFYLIICKSFFSWKVTAFGKCFHLIFLYILEYFMIKFHADPMAITPLLAPNGSPYQNLGVVTQPPRIDTYGS